MDDALEKVVGAAEDKGEERVFYDSDIIRG